MLDYRQTPSGYEVRQYLRPPGVYLDHWAFRRFSQDLELRRALADALADRDGTLVIGRLNLLEFTRVQDAAQVQAAEEFVQAVLPRVFFLDVQIMDVIKRENASRSFSACGDPQMFEYFGRPLLDDFQRWRAMKLFEILNGKAEEYRQGFATIERSVLDQLLEYSRLEPRELRSLTEANGRPRATLGLARGLTDQIFRDKSRPLELGDASDMMHAVVPCAYCDFVLLDAEWRDYVERVRPRLAKKQHVAAVYSGRGDGVERFLEALRAYPKDANEVVPWPETAHGLAIAQAASSSSALPSR
jgi:hypothetical protein